MYKLLGRVNQSIYIKYLTMNLWIAFTEKGVKIFREFLFVFLLL